jgi:ankyrin repeat protein
MAAEKGHIEIVKALLERGADVNLAKEVSVGRKERRPFFGSFFYN